MASRLADILKQEYKTKGIFSGTTSAIGKSMREKLDIRNALFGGSGLGSVIGRKIFGKGYSALGSDKSKVSESSDNLISASTSILQEININGKIAAKNSMSLPLLAQQMNIMQKNVAKLVKLQGEKPSTKADSFFSNAKFRENAYEARYNKSAKSPTKVETKTEGSGLFGMIGGIISALGSAVGAVLKPFGSLTTMLLSAAGILSLFGRGIGKILAFLAGTRIGKILGIGALLAGSSMAFGGGDETANLEPTQNTGGGISGGAIVGGTAAAIGAAGVASFAGKTMGSGGLVSKTSEAILDARTTPSNVSYKGATPSTKWGKFLQFVERRAPKLFAKFGARLAAAGALATIPVFGWIGALINLGFTLLTAYEIYQLWKMFTGEDKEESGNTPSRADEELTVSFNDKGLPISTQMSPTNVTQQRSSTPSSGNSAPIGTGKTFNDMSREEQDNFLKNQAIAEGSYKSGTVGNRHNNPGNIIAKSPTEVYPAQAKFGGVPGETITGPDGKTRTFVKFPTWEAGVEAQRDLWQRKYGNQPIETALKSWVDPSTSTEMANYQKNMGVGGSKTELAGTGNEKAFVGTKLNMGSRALANQQKGGDTNVAVVNQAPVAAPQNNQQIAVATPSAFDSELSKFLLKPMVL